MPTTREFSTEFLEGIDPNGKEVIIEFFITFARFEYALKGTPQFLQKKGDNRAEADWDKFAASISEEFEHQDNSSLINAANYILHNPPKKQMVRNGECIWADSNPQGTRSHKLSIYIRRIRNNLFHGGKFIGRFDSNENSRNYLLISYALIILNNWLYLHEQVSNKFFEPIERIRPDLQTSDWI